MDNLNGASEATNASDTISALLANFCDYDVSSFAAVIKEIMFVDEFDFDACAKLIVEIAIKELKLSSKYAELAKELENVPFHSKKSSDKLNFKDAVLRFLHFKFDQVQYDLNSRHKPDVKRFEGILNLIGNLFNVNFLSSALLRYWLSSLMTWRNKLPARTLLAVVQKKVRAGSARLKNDIYLSSIMKMLEEMEIEENAGQDEPAMSNST